QTVYFTGQALNDVVLVNTGAGGSDDISLGADLDIDGDFTLTDGDFNPGTFSVNIAGDYSSTGGSFTAGDSKVVFDGTGAQTVTANWQTFNDMIIAKSNTIVFTDGFTVSDLTNTTGNTSMYFQNDLTITITGTLTLDGTSGNLITLDTDDEAANNFLFDVSGGDALVSYLNVDHADALSNDISCTSCTDGGNNNTLSAGFPDWLFTTIYIWDGSTDGTWATAANWDVGSGFPLFEIVGLPDKAVSESKERVRSAIVNSDLKFLPGNKKRVVVNLAPADIKKEGSVYDLPIALGILIATEQVLKEWLKETALFIGELSLNGELRHTKGILPMVILAKAKKINHIFVPEPNVEEASLVGGLNIYPIHSLKHLLEHLSGQIEIKAVKSKKLSYPELDHKEYEYDFGYIKGQSLAKRALEIAAAGAHNVLMIGVPGSGKTLLARSMPSILPRMTKAEILEVTKIYSVAGLLQEDEYLKYRRPFRSPHHTISDVAMVGGGQIPRPGEVSLSHRGVLFLDELTHFNSRVLESLRQPLEDGHIFVSRARGSVSYPCKFILISSMNPCRCGYYGDKEHECKCSAGDILRYRRKISGPFLDRIDLHLSVRRVKIEKLMSDKIAEESKEIRKRIEQARTIQNKRFEKLKIITNAEMSVPQIKKFCQIDQDGESLLKDAIEKFLLSARAYHRILKVSRTIADLIGEEKIGVEHIAESIQYRTKVDENPFN
ncbi:YifB family Mg chelatase-like AAA ATPase, partial [Patescibacteria group bacterium]|nr:YifB family Mg chelatase-like AAA ATPase [Patescibacteria group bacterium]